MKNLIKEINDMFYSLKSWKGEKQLEYMLEKISIIATWEELNSLDNETKFEILRSGMSLNRKSYLNVIAKNINIKLTDDDIKLWKNLESCDDNSFAIELIRKQKNWMDYDNGYFFEQAFLHSRKFFVSYAEKINEKNLLNVFKDNIDVNFLLKTEKNTNLSIWTYFAKNHDIWGDCLTNIFNIKPGWLEKDYYNIINNNQSHINEDSVDWNRINKGLDNYSEKAKNIVRNILDITVCQKVDKSYIFESNNISISLLSQMWLLKKEHFDLNIFRTEEKEKLLEKLLNNQSSFIYILSKNNEGILVKNIINSSLSDEKINWKRLSLNDNAWKALKNANLETIFLNNILRSDLENNLDKSNVIHKKAKI